MDWNLKACLDNLPNITTHFAFGEIQVLEEDLIKLPLIAAENTPGFTAGERLGNFILYHSKEQELLAISMSSQTRSTSDDSADSRDKVMSWINDLNFNDHRIGRSSLQAHPSSKELTLYYQATLLVPPGMTDEEANFFDRLVHTTLVRLFLESVKVAMATAAVIPGQ